MPRVTRDDVSLAYEHERANGDAPTVVFLQGIGLGCWQWRWIRDGLQGTEQLSPDTRGTGRSDPGLAPLVPGLPTRLRRRLLTGRFAYDVGGLAADLEAVLEDAGVRRAHLVGLDLGGAVAQRYALEYTRAASLTLIGTTHGGSDAVPMPDETRDQLLARPGPTERETVRHRTRPLFTDAFSNRNPHLMDRLIEWRLERDPADPSLEAQLGAFERFDVTERLSRLRVPSLVIHGAEDRVVPVANGRLLHEALPDSQYFELENGAHACVIENAVRIAERLERFLGAVSEGESSVAVKPQHL